MFQQRQINDVYQLVEVSSATIGSPGALTTTSFANTLQAFTVGANGVGTAPATFTQGDILMIIPSAGVAINGVDVFAQVTSTVGSARVVWMNQSGSTITPAAGVYTIIAIRITPQLI
jgi:hypothetical protein